MKLSTKGRYGTRAMLDLAVHYGQGAVSLRDISRRERISERYLQQIMVKLSSRGLVRSARGQNGGFLLARPPEKIHLSEIIEVLEGSLAPAECREDDDCCTRTSVCVTREIWEKAHRASREVLESFTLRDMAEIRERKFREEPEQMYHI